MEIKANWNMVSNFGILSEFMQLIEKMEVKLVKNTTMVEDINVVGD